MSTPSSQMANACQDYRQYLQAILKPAMRDLMAMVEEQRATLHHVFGANLFIAHAIDYLHAIRQADGIAETRRGFVTAFDSLFGVDGSRLRDRKFELIDAINNALKHIRLNGGADKNLDYLKVVHVLLRRPNPSS